MLMKSKLTDNYFTIFAKYVADITSGESTIVYTDFIADVGVIVSSLNQVGIESVGYHGEMDPKDRMESYSSGNQVKFK